MSYANWHCYKIIVVMYSPECCTGERSTSVTSAVVYIFLHFSVPRVHVLVVVLMSHDIINKGVYNNYGG